MESDLYMEKPKLLIIAGPNGSGKTTFTRLLLGHHWSEYRSPELLFRTRDGKIYKKYSDLNKHDWAIEILKQLRGLCK